jgi:hypothetical protein
LIGALAAVATVIARLDRATQYSRACPHHAAMVRN